VSMALEVLTQGLTPEPIPELTLELIPEVSGTITISQKSGANQWWYAVTVTASSGLTVTGLKMKGSGQWSWEDGVAEWDYYKFTSNAPYSAPLSFQVTLSTGQVVEGQVINSISDGSSGTLSVSSHTPRRKEMPPPKMACHRVKRPLW